MADLKRTARESEQESSPDLGGVAGEKNADARAEEVNPKSAESERVYEPTAVHRDEHTEGSLTRLIEQQTAKVPSDFFLLAAFGAIGLSLYYFASGNRNRGNLLGLWAPTLLTMGVYNKLVKMLKPR